MAKIKIEIKHRWNSSVLFSFEKEDNTLRDTVIEAVEQKKDLSEANLSRAYLSEADLSEANLSRADLSEANLSEADLSGANLSGANLSGANLSGANLSEANLSEADLSEANLSRADLSEADLRQMKDPEKQLPEWYINSCKRDMLFVFEHLKPELPEFRKKLVAGEIDGTQYEGKCACLIGTMAKVDGGLDKVCSAIPFYSKGLHNFGEQWFWQIHEKDTPEKSYFAKVALEMVDYVLAEDN